MSFEHPDPKTLPSYMKRPSDGELFVLANDGKYYVKAMLENYPEHAHQGHSRETLKCYRFTDYFNALPHEAQLGPRAIFTVKLL
jgi:hypothetical protein